MSKELYIKAHEALIEAYIEEASVCSFCDGTGRIALRHANDPFDPGTDCPKCDGAGELEVSWQDAYEATADDAYQAMQDDLADYGDHLHEMRRERECDL